MAKAPAKKRAPAKSKAKSTVKAPIKPKFDKEAFVFDTPVEEIEKALQRLEEQEADPMADPLTKDQIYYWVVWLNSLPDAKKRGMTHVPTCAIENAVLGLYDKSTKRKSK